MAGSSMKGIKLRMKSVESTMQITKAMQLVATSKLRRAKERMEASKPYAVISREAMMAAVGSCEEQSVPFAAQRSVKSRCYVVIAGERGLAGGYNANVFKAVAAHTEEIPYCVLPLGRKAIDKFSHLGVRLLSQEYSRVESLSVGTCYKLAKQLIEGYLNEEYDELFLVYTSFQSMMSQEVVIEKLLPIEKPPIGEGKKRIVSTVYEPQAAETLQAVVPDFIAGRLYSAACDSFVSEVSARRSAMDSATKNAGEMISDLRLKYNRARQGAITQEITEIVAGAEN
ncbi:MAG: ATP synthase F1 subunit gamma [Clostridia bacterium]|nr:ATP synthase F1 subunit gamma [Clostridia bacterium]